MAKTPTSCPKCASENIYQDSDLWICPECSQEWTPESGLPVQENSNPDTSIRDANGNILNEGDSVIVLKDLKIKGASGAVKGGTKVRNIKLVGEAEDGHNIFCKIDGIGSIHLKSEFVRKA